MSVHVCLCDCVLAMMSTHAGLHLYVCILSPASGAWEGRHAVVMLAQELLGCGAGSSSACARCLWMHGHGVMIMGRSDTYHERGTPGDHLRGEPVASGADSTASEASPWSDHA